MPAKSGKQYRFMQAAAHGSMKGVGGPSPEVAKEFINKTPQEKRKKFSHALMKHKKPMEHSGMKKLFMK